MISCRRLTGCYLISVVLFVSSLQAATIVNPSFEQPEIPALESFAFFTASNTIGAGWVVDPTSESAVLVLKSGALDGPTTPDGGQYALISDGSVLGSIHQDLLLDAADYRLSFALGAGEDNVAAGVRVNVSAGSGGGFGGTLFSVPIGSGFEVKELLFTAPTSGTYRLSVAAESGGAAIDAFSLQEVTAIPEPSIVGMLATATIVPFGIRRWRRTTRPIP